ncbi:LHFPL tetraspan subfamily member 2 protein [Lycorma delicatula]|uniref:LHFPL tetraspan subfamily member 2 protein n=1 Tax=Lycorma delicatula TaxID=130591 RepID=UPI003F514F4B
MAHVIITPHSLSWVLLTITVTLAIFSGLVTPQWLLGPKLIAYANGTMYMLPSVGIFSRCTKLHDQKHCAIFATDGLATANTIFPTFWKAALLLISLGLAVMVFTVMAAVLSCCVQSVYKKSIFTVTGSVQAIAGLLYLLGLICYAAGWGSGRVQRLCGKEAAPFSIGDCSIGWALYITVIGIVLTFVTSWLSVKAEKTTSSDEVSDHVERGETLVCLL